MKIYKLPLFRILLFLLTLGLTSCSKDDDSQQVCMETSVTMTVNGELQEFQALGRGIDLRQNGYLLQLNLDRRSTDRSREQTMVIRLPYKKTGENIIEEFLYRQYINGISFSGDLINEDFQSHVTTNTRNCFYATFSGKISDGNQEVIFSDGIVSFKYEPPFDE